MTEVLSEHAARTALEFVQAEWNRAMATWDAGAVARLYDPMAQLFGSLPELFQSADGARAYYSAFATAEACEASFDNRSIMVPAPGVIVASGFVTFAMRIAGDTREAAFRFTFVLREADRWYIVAHHASPIPHQSPAD